MIGVTWTGWDGSVWDLHAGPVRLAPGFEGFSMLTADAFVRETAMTDGQFFTGWRATPRPVLFPVLIGQAGTASDWLALETAWWKTMRFDRPGKLSVKSVDGSVRSLKLRFVDDGGMATKRDPSHDRLTVAPLKMMADDPWWTGAMFSQTFDNGGQPINFFGAVAGGRGTPFFISKGSTLRAANIENPGDIAVWPKYTITGPTTSFRSVLGGQAVGGPITVVEGQRLEIDTSPQQQVAYLIDGSSKTNVTRKLTEFAFARLPDGGSVRLDIQLGGTGAVTLSAAPKYYRAW